MRYISFCFCSSDPFYVSYASQYKEGKTREGKFLSKSVQSGLCKCKKKYRRRLRERGVKR